MTIEKKWAAPAWIRRTPRNRGRRQLRSVNDKALTQFPCRTCPDPGPNLPRPRTERARSLPFQVCVPDEFLSPTDGSNVEAFRFEFNKADASFDGVGCSWDPGGRHRSGTAVGYLFRRVRCSRSGSVPARSVCGHSCSCVREGGPGNGWSRSADAGRRAAADPAHSRRHPAGIRGYAPG